MRSPCDDVHIHRVEASCDCGEEDEENVEQRHLAPDSDNLHSNCFGLEEISTCAQAACSDRRKACPHIAFHGNVSTVDDLEGESWRAEASQANCCEGGGKEAKYRHFVGIR